MRRLLLFAWLPLALWGDSVLYTCAVSTRNYVVGAKLPPSGVFLRNTAAGWRHVGFNLPFLSALDYDPGDPRTVYVAAGNGLLRLTGDGEKWKILTGSDVTELLDVAVDPNSPGTICFSHSAGIRVSHDRGATWQDAGATLHRKYTAALRVDRRKRGVLLAGNEEGIFRSEDEGRTWRLAGAAGYQVLRVEQSPHDACYWLAATEGGGLFESADCGVTFESNGSLGVGRNLYDIAFDPKAAGRIAVAGWGPGVALSEDRGKTWQLHNAGLPAPSVWSVAFDPSAPGTIYAGVHDEGVYVSRDNGRTWARDGMQGTAVYRMKFLPGERP